MSDFSKEEIQELADKAAAKAVQDTLKSLGFDMENPMDIQRNMLYLDTQRRATESVSKFTRITIWGFVISGIVSAISLGVISGIKGVMAP
ncbi:hypothetical protein [Spongiibacter tropicus]|uniref:hypothetical protein n=1 Tax=Spongiibacter tropicus TaxID=454602 RepID=UPI0003B68981|nr:hypothetical protein [Spongiibacter tropicus]